MKLFDLIEDNKNKNINIYCDMDGVIAEYDVNNFNYDTIRPIKTSINNLKRLKEYDNVNIFILSICKTNEIASDKIIWLDKNINFLDKDKIILLSKEQINNKESKEIKLNYLKEHINLDYINILIDDDINIIKEIKNNLKEINIFHVSSLID